MSSTLSDNFASFLYHLDTVSFSSLTTVAKTCNTNLNQIDDARHSGLVSEFSGKSFIFSWFNVMVGYEFVINGF